MVKNNISSLHFATPEEVELIEVCQRKKSLKWNVCVFVFKNFFTFQNSFQMGRARAFLDGVRFLNQELLLNLFMSLWLFFCKEILL